MPPALQAIDHIHVHVAHREAAERWYAQVLGLRRVAALAHWAADGGPLTLADDTGQVHVALFERPPAPCHATIALRVDGASFEAWRAHLETNTAGHLAFEDHGESVSLYFSDPDGNPYEITTYEVAAVRQRA